MKKHNYSNAAIIYSSTASCPVVGSIKNGIITPVTLKGGGEVGIKCHTNYTLVGSPKLICTNGRWNDSLPTCGGNFSVTSCRLAIFQFQIINKKQRR